MLARLGLTLLLLAPTSAFLLTPSIALRTPIRRAIHVNLAADTSIMEPSTAAELGPTDTVELICSGLQQNDSPHDDAGVERLYHFTTPMGRVNVAPPPPRSGLQGGVELDYWMENAAAPFLGALCFCAGYKLIGEPRISPGSNTRGKMCQQLVEVGNSPLDDESNAVKTLEKLANAPDDFLAEGLTHVREGTADRPAAPEQAQLKSRFWFKLNQERRPPLQDCWLLEEVLGLELTKFQELNEGGEEFEGDDPGE